MFFYDWTFIILIPGIILALYAQSKVHTAFNSGSKKYSKKGLSSEIISRKILNTHGCSDVSIRHIQGHLNDNYNPMDKSLSLSSSVYGKHDLASIGIAAHETGHAIQDSEAYFPLRIRNAIVPVVSFGSSLSPIIFLVGFIFSFTPLMNIGIIFFVLTVIFSLITLPVEIDASKRAKKLLVEDGYLDNEELITVNKVLDAAALTYVAALLNGLLNLARLIILRNSRD